MSRDRQKSPDIWWSVLHHVQNRCKHPLRLQLTFMTSKHLCHSHLLRQQETKPTGRTRNLNRSPPKLSPNGPYEVEVQPRDAPQGSTPRLKTSIRSFQENSHHTGGGPSTASSRSDKLDNSTWRAGNPERVGWQWEDIEAFRSIHGGPAELPQNMLSKSGDEEKQGKWKLNYWRDFVETGECRANCWGKILDYIVDDSW